MKVRTHFLLGFLAVIGIGLPFFVWWIIADLEPEYRKATEEPLVETARILASLADTNAKNGTIDVDMFRRVFEDDSQYPFTAKIFDYVKKDVDFRVYITDKSGIVLFDSHDSTNIGKDFSQWMDVHRTLRGEYGARTSRDPDNPGTPIMYVASPIYIDGKMAGVISVGKPTKTARLFAVKSRNKIIIAGTVMFVAMILSVVVLSGYITNPIRRLTDYARQVRDGKRVSLPVLSSGEVRELGEAFDEMRDALEGKQHVERYVQSLAHEIKSPLSAISGAAELMKEDMPAGQRERFLSNIRDESQRIETIVDKLMLLSSLEARKQIQQFEKINLAEIVEQVKKSMVPVLDRKNLSLEVSGEHDCIFEGDPFLVRHAIINLILNAIEFSPAGRKITAEITNLPDTFAQLAIRDKGPGIPEYAIERIYERFYSLKRPDSGRKSSGLGLSLVKEIASLHHGEIRISNDPDGGVSAVLRFPVSQNS